jgi:hypothetical protein
MGSKTTQKTTPYDPAAIKGAQGALTGANTAANATLSQYSPVLNNAMAHIQANISGPPAYQTDARNELDKTINGDYLSPDSNPYSSGLADLIAKRTQGQYNTTYGASGRSHGGMAALLSAQGVGDALGNFYSGIYDQERGRQQQAVGMAPAFHQDEYTDINNLVPAVNSQAMLPLNIAGQYASSMGNLIAPYSTTTQKQSGLGTVLGPALGLAGMIGGAALTGGTSLMPGLLGGAGGGLSGMLGSAGNNIGGGISMGRFLG